MAAWDYQAIKKQSDIEAIIKIIRLIANIFTVNQIGKDIYMNDPNSFRELVKKLKGLLQKKSNIEKSSVIFSFMIGINSLYIKLPYKCVILRQRDTDVEPIIQDNKVAISEHFGRFYCAD